VLPFFIEKYMKDILIRHIALLSLFIGFLFLSSCSESGRKKPEVAVSKLPKIMLTIHRYGKALFEADTMDFATSLKALKKSFPYFLDADLDDTANVKKLYDYVADTQIIRIAKQTFAIYPELTKQEKLLGSAFAHLKYYFPNYSLPTVYTYISDLYFEQPVIKQDSVLIIALDDYLGPSYPLYAALNIPRYKTRCMQAKNIVPDVMRTLYLTDFKSNRRTSTLLDKMIENGKLLYFLDAVLPNFPDSLKICYTGRQMKWIEEHKQDVWAFLIANKMLYSTDYMAINELTQAGPFTKGFGNDSPPAIANYLGWQIVSAYMQRFSHTSLHQLFKMKDAQKLLKDSRYKP